MIINDELAWISGLLAQKGIRFWVDSGTLLGLVREGNLLPGDQDIDIGMWADDEPLLKDLIPAIRAKGYKVIIRRYNDLTYKYKLIPARIKSDLIIEIGLYRVSEGYAWCPLVFPKSNKYGKKNLFAYLYGSFRFCVNLLFDRFKVISVAHWPWSTICKVYAWWIPHKFYSEIVMLADNISVPKDFEAYLEFRYGNWKVPEKRWNFYMHDGGIRRECLENIIN